MNICENYLPLSPELLPLPAVLAVLPYHRTVSARGGRHRFISFSLGWTGPDVLHSWISLPTSDVYFLWQAAAILFNCLFVKFQERTHHMPPIQCEVKIWKRKVPLYKMEAEVFLSPFLSCLLSSDKKLTKNTFFVTSLQVCYRKGFSNLDRGKVLTREPCSCTALYILLPLIQRRSSKDPILSKFQQASAAALPSTATEILKYAFDQMAK